MALQNSASSYISYGTSSALGPASDWTFHCIITPTVATGSDGGVFGKRSGFTVGTNQYNVTLGGGNSRIPIATKDNKYIGFGSGLSLNVQYLLSFSCTAAGIKCWINGSRVNSAFSNHSATSDWRTGAAAPSSPVEFFTNGAGLEVSRISLSEVGLWSVALSDAELASLHKAFSPLLVRPTSLEMCWTFRGGATGELMQGYTATVTGTVSPATHPRIYA